MKKKIIVFLIISLFTSIGNSYSNDIYQTIQPEKSSEKKTIKKSKFGEFKKFVVVTANEYATKIGYDILDKGGTVADAVVAIQLTLGLVEPQSSGLGGGLFITYHDSKTNSTISFEGREKAPKKLNSDVFLKANGEPIKFFEAVIGGKSVGVPATLKTLYEFHKNYGTLKWEEIIKPVINLSSNGFVPPNRLINALEKEKFLFDLYPNSIFKQILKNPKKKFFNNNYTKTLKKISQDISIFYNKEIAKKIVSTVNNSKNPGNLSLKDMKEYEIIKNNALCFKLQNGFKICGPNLPSSGTICIIQALILYQNLFNNELKSKPSLEEHLNILNYIYFLRDNFLADPNFISIDIKKILDQDYIIKNYKIFKETTITSNMNNINEIFSSTSHYTLIDRYNNILSATSSIESSFGSRLFTNGFFLNNQLTDFSFNIKDRSGRLINNRPEPGKRPLSSMSPLIVFDKNNSFFLTIGSPGGKAIISYIFKSLVSLLYENQTVLEAIESPNYIRIHNRTFVESEKLNQKLENKGQKRDLTSGLAIIKKENGKLIAGADSRRDGTVKGN